MPAPVHDAGNDAPWDTAMREVSDLLKDDELYECGIDVNIAGTDIVLTLVKNKQRKWRLTCGETFLCSKKRYMRGAMAQLRHNLDVNVGAEVMLL